jgi:predicted nucleic acid-binding Zn ribbon protein
MRDLTPEEQEQFELQQIKQRSSRYQAKPIGSAIRQVIARSGLGQTQAADELLAAWKSVAGPALGSVSRPGNISRGVLQVFVRDSSALQELHMSRKQLLAALKQAMPQLTVKDIRGKVG